MHSLLAKLLKKRNITDITKENKETQETYEHWQKILSEGEITLDKIIEFCNNQIILIETQWKNLDNAKEKNERLIIIHTVYKTLVDLITKPPAEKEALEKYLQQLVNE